jgi:hypothetical protein
MRPWSIAYGKEKEHAAALVKGFYALPLGFNAELCHGCGGEGQRRQMFTAGCGGGYFHSMAGCDICDGTGVMQGGRPAPMSVLNQILTAAGYEHAYK